MCSSATDAFALARLNVSADTNVDALAAMLTQHYPSVLVRMYKRARIPVWRIVRRCSAPVMRHMHSPDYVPARMMEIELGEPLPTIYAVDEKEGCYYQRAVCLIRLHTQPLGTVEIPLVDGEASPNEYVEHIWRTLGSQINEHLRQDGLPPITTLEAAGLPGSGTPLCIEKREQFLAHAPFVSIIVPTHNRLEQLQCCLRSLLALQYPHYEIIVVDNAPNSSATADFIQRTYHAGAQVRYLREDRPGASWARNCGIMAARGEIVVFADDDIVVDAYWLAELVKGFSVTDKVACVTGLLLPLELDTPAQFLIEEFGGFSKGYSQRLFDLVENHPHTPLHPFTAGQFGTGASMAFKAEFLRRANNFDPALGPGTPAKGGEDLTLFFQAIIQGYTLVYEPRSIAYHPHRREYADLQKCVYDYGVGLTAYLTRNVLHNPRFLFDFVIRVPYGLYFVLSNRSSKNRMKSSHYPKELSRAERKGMLHGPLAYILSWWTIRRMDKHFETSRPPIALHVEK
ncbi:MAG TPA: glycosyltransferase, partial [Ktedonobacteraceae bacterium]|nr:glycosyltransferase [Ktedonobacteraceae bacterium]